ncbi:MAG: zf-HC2 domain-containing protein [Gammaproteobacteria bacterium]
MLTCRAASELISADYDRPLGARERFSLRMHLLICIPCKVAARQIALIQQFITSTRGSALSFSSTARLSTEARERITNKIAEHSQ